MEEEIVIVARVRDRELSRAIDLRAQELTTSADTITNTITT